MNRPPTKAAKPKSKAKTLRRTGIPKQVIQAVERERERIGQDLHDDICQILTGVSCLVQVSAGRVEKTLPSEADRLREINARVIDAMNRARAICHGLHPAHAIGRTVTETVNELARQSTGRFDIKIIKKIPLAGTSLPNHTEEQLALLFLIAQEAICNAVRHGRASEITLRLSPGENCRVHLQIEDNGKGLCKSSADGFGLRIMRQRAVQLGGSIAIKPSAKGTVFSLTYGATLSSKASK